MDLPAELTPQPVADMNEGVGPWDAHCLNIVFVAVDERHGFMISDQSEQVFVEGVLNMIILF